MSWPLSRWAGPVPDELGEEPAHTIICLSFFLHFPDELATFQMRWPFCRRAGWGAGPWNFPCVCVDQATMASHVELIVDQYWARKTYQPDQTPQLVTLGSGQAVMTHKPWFHTCSPSVIWFQVSILEFPFAVCNSCPGLSALTGKMKLTDLFSHLFNLSFYSFPDGGLHGLMSGCRGSSQHCPCAW